MNVLSGCAVIDHKYEYYRGGYDVDVIFNCTMPENNVLPQNKTTTCIKYFFHKIWMKLIKLLMKNTQLEAETKSVFSTRGYI